MVKEVEGPKGKFCQTSYWKLKKKILPSTKQMPMSKRDNKGNLITSSNSLRELYFNTYKQRLSPAIIKKNYRTSITLFEIGGKEKNTILVAVSLNIQNSASIY